jgi:hypothetical protein
MLTALRRAAIFAAVTALVSVVLMTWLAPGMLRWWAAPPVQEALSCSRTVEWAARTYREIQLSSLVGGVVVGFVLALVTRRKTTQSLGPAPASAIAAPADTAATATKK